MQRKEQLNFIRDSIDAFEGPFTKDEMDTIMEEDFLHLSDEELAEQTAWYEELWLK
ncbi:hypothetical protein 035JT004_101 [Bacillus phage 035JT004]|nr:hypothetical protein 035JT004_101 [Bacillus phage 035JT004]